MNENPNFNSLLKQLLEKVEPEKRTIALPIILDIIKRKQKNNINNESHNEENQENFQENIQFEKSELSDEQHEVHEEEETLSTEKKIIDVKENEEHEIERCDSNVSSKKQEDHEEDIKYSLHYHDNIIDNKESKAPCKVAEINATVEKSDNLDEGNDINTENASENPPTIKPTVLSCKATVYNGTTLKNCISEEVENPIALENSKESAMISVPVVLSQANIEVFIEAITKFPEPIFSIEDLDKSMTLTYCELIPNSNRLLLKGFVEKKIEYSNVIDISKREISGDIKNCIIRIPFKCATEVIFTTNPQKINYSRKQRVEIFKYQGALSKGKNIEEKSSIETQAFGNKVYCKLEDVTISEKSQKLGIVQLENTLDNAITFKKLKEKTIANFTLSILQNQDVFVFNKDETSEENRVNKA